MGIVDNANNAAKEKWERSGTIQQGLKALGTWKKPSPYSCVSKSKFLRVEMGVFLLVNPSYSLELLSEPGAVVSVTPLA